MAAKQQCTVQQIATHVHTHLQTARAYNFINLTELFDKLLLMTVKKLELNEM